MKEEIACTKKSGRRKKSEKGSTQDMTRSEDSSMNKRKIWTLSRKRSLKRWIKRFLKLMVILVASIYPDVKERFNDWVDKKFPEKSVVVKKVVDKAVEVIKQDKSRQ